MSLKLRTAHWLNETGVRLIVHGRRIVQTIYMNSSHEKYFDDLLRLHEKIEEEVATQAREYPHYKYDQGLLYQGLSTLGVFGIRSTEDRFESYGLAKLIGPNDHILDIGCNCGFMAVFSAYRTGCRADGIDINPYMINIGRHCAEFLQVGDRVRLEAARFEDFKPANKYTAIFSFAVHWTDDEQHRPDFDQYLQRLHSLLADNGLLVFESHTLDVGKKEFYEKMERQRKFYSWDGSKLLDGNKRELFIMRKRATT